jgi:hypothetical protein
MAKKRWIAVLLSVVLAFSLIPFAAFGAENSDLILEGLTFSPVPNDRISTSLVTGVTAQTGTGYVDYMVNSKENTSDWDQNSGTGSVQSYTYVGLHVEIPEGAKSLKSSNDGDAGNMTDVTPEFMQGGKAHTWFPVANKNSNGSYTLLRGQREYTVLLEWYDENGDVLKREYVKASRNLANPAAEVNGNTYETLSDAVQAVVSSSSKSGTVTLLRNASGSGIGLFNGQGATGVSLTIDLGGYTYTCMDPAVGSSGTESQGFHLEMGNRVTLKNGTIRVDESSTKTKMLIQNYSDLTLQNLNLQGSSVTQYILSSNFGDITATNINISGTHPNLVAMDVMHWHGTAYEGKAPTMVIHNTSANRIQGAMDVYCYGAGSENCPDGASLTINGGTYSSDPSPYLADGWTVCFTEGSYMVHKHGDAIKIEAKAPTCTESGNIAYWYCPVCDRYYSDGDCTKEITLGETILPATGHSYENGVCTECGHTIIVDAPVIDTTKPVEDVQVGVKPEQTEQIKEEIAQIVEQITGGETSSAISEETASKLQQAIAAGSSVSTAVEFNNLKEVDPAITDKVESLLGENGYVAQFFDLSILLTADGVPLGEVQKLSKPMTFQLAIPAELLKENREFFIIRIHNGVAEKLKATLGVDNMLSFETDRFSTYALGYTDGTPENGENSGPVSGSGSGQNPGNVPGTGDGSGLFSWLMLLLAAFGVLGGAALINRKTEV